MPAAEAMAALEKVFASRLGFEAIEG